jgi:Tfp pilus assembly protein PilF
MRFEGPHRPPTPEIAKLLNVDAVVEGSVLRVGDRVRITAQLIDVPADKHLWADTYERDSRDVLALQDEVALAIAREINIELTPHEQARLTSSRPVDPQAHDAYLKGRYYLSNYSEERLRKAIVQFEEAIKADPDFAPAYTGLADAYGPYGSDLYFPDTEGMPKAKAAVQKALQLDNTLAEAHSSLAAIKVWYDFDPVGGEKEFRRAIALNPNYADAHHLYGFWLAQQGRFDESLAELKRAAELDPLSAGIAADVSLPLMYQGKYDAAREQCREALQLDPGYNIAQFLLGWTDVEAGKFYEAIPELEKAQAMGSVPIVESLLGYAYAKSGNRTKAEAIIAELNQMSSRRFVSPYCAAEVYLGLDDKRRALEVLEKAYEARSTSLLFLKVDNIFDPLRSDPQFIELLKKVGLNNLTARNMHSSYHSDAGLSKGE